MKNTKFIPLGIVMAVFVTTGCNDDFVNTQPLTEVSADLVWTDAGLAEAFVTDLYTGLGNGGFDEQMLASLTDEAIFTHPGRGINTITEARSNPADRGWINNTLDWPNMYARIRAANLALTNLESPGFDNPDMAQRLRGEAYFMRAYYYHQLVRYFGGVPLIDRPYELNEPDYMAPRNTFEECVDFIISDCDMAAQLLPVKGDIASGRANATAAMALKARILLYAASDLHDIPTASANSAAIASYSKPEYLGYLSGDRTARWQQARDAAKAVVDMTEFGYMLDLSAPATAEEGTANYVNMAMSRNGGDRELLFGRYFINAKQENGGRIGLFNGPNGYHNWAGNTPIQNLVDDYEMMDGTSFDWNNPAQASDPYSDRDPRFYATVLYDGAPWKPRTADVAGKDPFNEIQTGQYEVINAEGEKVPHFGLDTRQSSVEDWNGTRTGYYMRKFIDPNPSIVDQNTWQQIPWPFLRYTEMVFNYIEASLELGDEAEALAWLNKIRFRAGMPAVTASGQALRDRYRNERRIEMAYEEQRYHDARRWMIAPETLGQQAERIEIIGTLKPSAEVTLYRYDPAQYNYEYTPQDIDPGIENRQWDDKMYYLPIHRDEMNRNTELVQNPGY
ncbi:Starch-binding associating with outer membrane [Catalinimonas alkaloidigena]|uniref:Starch-binding associating with outer membrane n=1 Tax=Catalinimonas alkaloidigena TaxID=1075417 RepID=A0A1G9F8N9_9BACT|nr:RagB/SusD family nutrient uptake outer membrane protein [Catalinimonas alkaloidigena]SDK84563.1 Starch-binding associating with outer membrane [Catalinimonas alkaloidigena]